MIFATKETRSALFLVATLAVFLLVHSVAIGDQPAPSAPPATAPAATTPTSPAVPDGVKAQADWKQKTETAIGRLTEVGVADRVNVPGDRFADKNPSQRMNTLLDLTSQPDKFDAMRKAFEGVNASNGLSSFLRASGFSESSISAIVTDGTMLYANKPGQTFTKDPEAYKKLSSEEVSALNALSSQKGGNLIKVFDNKGFCPGCETSGPGFNEGFRSAWTPSGTAQPAGTKIASNASPGCASCNKGGSGPGASGPGSCSSCGQNGGQGAGQGAGQSGGQGGGQNGGQGQNTPPLLPPMPPVGGPVGATGGAGAGSGGSGGSGSSSDGGSKGGSVATIAGPGKIAGSPATELPKEAVPVFVSTKKKKRASSASEQPDSFVAAVIPKIEEAPKASELTERQVSSTGGGETMEGPQAQVPSSLAANAAAPTGESAKAFANSFDTSEARSGHGLTRDSE
jgi:hypothetical protein